MSAGRNKKEAIHETKTYHKIYFDNFKSSKKME